MLKQSSLRKILLLTGLGQAAWLFLAAQTAVPPVPADVVVVAKPNPAPAQPPAPGPDDGKIAYVTARLLEQNHYLQHPLDDAFSEKFFDRYLDAFDPQHMHFLESDLAEFEVYRTTLDDLTLSPRGLADTTPAYKIFARFLERLDQRVAYVNTLLKSESFTFDADERILINRKDAPYPRDLAEARELWRQRLRFEYLQEKLGRSSEKQTSERPTVKVNGKKTEAEEIADLLTRRYQRNLHMFQEWESDEVLQVYLTALARVYDPHSDYFNNRQAENFAIGMNLALFGIGAELYSDDGYCTIRRLTPNGPAEKSKKIKPKDRIVAVAQSNAPPVDVVDMNLNKVVQMIRGPKGTEVRLTIIPAEDSAQRRVITLIRDEIKLEDQAAKAKVIDLPSAEGKTVRLGVIDLPSFYASIDLGGPRRPNLAGEGGAGEVAMKAAPRSTSVDVARLLKKLRQENVAGIILDLRRNGGGSLEEAIKLTGLFIKRGPVVQAHGPDGDPIVYEDDDPGVAYEGPLVVLTSRFSASASEIVAGALQDYGRALVVGDVSTHGKGTVQNLNPLRMMIRPTGPADKDPGALKVTIRKFYRAGGSSTQLKGVMPDIVLPSVLNYSEDIGEKALDNPLPWDTIPSARFQKADLVAAHLPELLQRSTQRVATNRDFAYIREDIDLFKQRQADKTISLNERERLKEKEEEEARKKARDLEFQARKDSDQKVYLLALKDVDLPGLPPPVEKTNTVTATHGGGKGAVFTAGTNATATTTTASSEASDDADEDDEVAESGEKWSVEAATLEEAERILLDYIELLSRKSLLSANQP